MIDGLLLEQAAEIRDFAMPGYTAIPMQTTFVLRVTSGWGFEALYVMYVETHERLAWWYKLSNQRSRPGLHREDSCVIQREAANNSAQL
jgi:hypothetical protein